MRSAGAACAQDADCASGHCDGVCCAKGSECCRTISDCTVYAQGVGASCEDWQQCRGVAGKMTCSPDFRCVVMSGVRNDMACDIRVEASDCGPYPSVYCSGGMQQDGAPPCSTQCSDDRECDEAAHCDEHECVLDAADGEPCDEPTDCMHGECKNAMCCAQGSDCCKSANDCPDTYSESPKCLEPQTCKSSGRVALCEANRCASMEVRADAACDGKLAQACGAYRDVVCLAGNAVCPTSCIDENGCDADAFCDAGKCVPKRQDGQPCTASQQCTSGNCGNGVCCGAGMECCQTVQQCTRSLDLRCVNDPPCQGSRRSVTCSNWSCVYNLTDPTSRIPDDTACTASVGGSDCGIYRDLKCNGQFNQPQCLVTCTTSADCDANAMCASDSHCMLRP